jgi:hypothetical protein
MKKSEHRSMVQVDYKKEPKSQMLQCNYERLYLLGMDGFSLSIVQLNAHLDFDDFWLLLSVS